MDRVFATGHSSGAQMIVQILTHRSDAEHMNVRAVAPVAASDYGALQVPTPVMYIQGNGRAVNPGCISYSGCSEPTIWCSHDDPAYSNTSHGVPCFAIQAMHDLFADMP
ncbi:hypothetical protein [Sorangium sp. So ce233]|uniref:hypothetical protein n=1 Tax=Sorangium sp. So ce233 TaxID=3133290 RepID=UPI003F5FC60C